MITTRPDRRQQSREEIRAEALTLARRLLAEDGVDRVTISAVGREMGIAAPNMYRYFSGRGDLLVTVYRDRLEALVAFQEAGVARQTSDLPGDRIYAATHALLVWARASRNAFDLLMGSGYRIAVTEAEEIRTLVARRVSLPFVPAFVELWTSGELDLSRVTVPDVLAGQLLDYRTHMTRDAVDASDMPVELVHAMVTGWRQIFGVLMMQAYDHGSFAFGDYDALLDDMIRTWADRFGVRMSQPVVLSYP